MVRKNNDFIVPLEMNNEKSNVYVLKRPHVDHFLTEVSKIFEVVIYTASMSKYADPLIDILDP